MTHPNAAPTVEPLPKASREYREGLITGAEIAAEMGASGVAEAIRRHAAKLAPVTATPAGAA